MSIPNVALIIKMPSALPICLNRRRKGRPRRCASVLRGSIDPRPVRDYRPATLQAEKDYNVFRTEEGKTAWSDTTPLEFGKLVLSPPTKDGAGRDVRYQMDRRGRVQTAEGTWVAGS